MKNSNINVLMGLVVLTLASYFLSQQSVTGRGELLLLLFTVIKVFLVVLYFMEMRKAHFGWLGVLGFVLVVFVIFIFVLGIL